MDMLIVIELKCCAHSTKYVCLYIATYSCMLYCNEKHGHKKEEEGKNRHDM